MVFNLQAKNVSSVVLQPTASNARTWDQDTATWDQNTGTWDEPGEIFAIQTKNLSAISLQAKH